jgi:dihydrolipoamide dehydrogenase
MSETECTPIGDMAGTPMLAYKANARPRRPSRLAPSSGTSRIPREQWIATEGLIEVKAKDQDFMVKVAWLNFAGNGEAIALGESRGMVKTIFDAGSGAHGGGTERALLVQASPARPNLRAEQPGHSIFPHPERVETIREPVLDAYGRVVPF